MLGTSRWFIGSIVAIGLIPFHALAASKGVLLEVKRQAPVTATGPKKLSPALQATKDSGGVLKGNDESGRLVISVPEANIAGLANSAAVAKVIEQDPPNWNPVQKLKLSYKAGAKPTEEALKGMSLRLVEDYAKGSFMIVEPIEGRAIDAQLAGSLEQNPSIQYATPALRIKAIPPTNVVVGPPATAEQPPTNDPRWGELWGMRNIRAPQAWQTLHDSKVVVAVIDTGVDFSHEDLKENMWKDANGKHGFDFVDNDDVPMDLQSHGTHCAGTVGAVGNNEKGVVGVNWKVEIMAVRWLDANGSGEVADAIKSIDFAVDNGAKILSNSWFWTEDDPDLAAAIQRAQDAKCLFVAAAGNFAQRSNNNLGDNDNASTFGRIPSAYPNPNIIAVAAINESEQLADFSEWGKKSVDLAAPGVLVLSTVPDNKYDGTFSGTSMATPHVAGALALAWAYDPNADFLAIKERLLKAARPIDAMKDKCTTNGTLDISFIKPAPTAK